MIYSDGMERGLQVIRVLIAAGDPEEVEHIQTRLDDAFPIQVIGSTSSGRECWRRIDEQHPDVILIGESLEDSTALDLSRQIGLTRRGIATILVTENFSVDLYDRAAAAGVRRVIPMPALRERLTIAIEEAFHLETSAPDIAREEAGEGRVITIYSAKGGVGKTFVATNLAALWATLDPVRKVLLVDLNLQFGLLSQALDVEPNHTVFDLFPVIEDLSAGAVDSVLVKKDLLNRATLSVLTGPTDPRQADSFQGKHINALLMALKRQFQLIIVDTTSTVSDVTLAALQVSNHILLVCTPDVPTVRQTRAAIELLSGLGVRKDKLHIVLNRVSKLAEVQPSDVERLFDVGIAATLTEDIAAVQPLTNSGGLLVENIGRSALLNDFKKLADGIVPPPKPPVEAKTGKKPQKRKRPPKNTSSRRRPQK